MIATVAIERVAVITFFWEHLKPITTMGKALIGNRGRIRLGGVERAAEWFVFAGRRAPVEWHVVAVIALLGPSNRARQALDGAVATICRG